MEGVRPVVLGKGILFDVLGSKSRQKGFISLVGGLWASLALHNHADAPCRPQPANQCAREAHRQMRDLALSPGVTKPISYLSGLSRVMFESAGFGCCPKVPFCVVGCTLGNEGGSLAHNKRVLRDAHQNVFR